jgi:hypothetical protein
MKDDDNKDDELSAAEVAEQEKKDAIARGDVVDDDELAKAAAEAEDDDGSVKTPEELEAEATAAALAAKEAEDDDDEPGDDADDGINIPKARYDEDRQKSRVEKAQLEARIKELEGKGRKKDEGPTIAELQTEIEELEDKYEAHLLEGETTEAAALRRETNIKRNALTDRKIKDQSSAMGAAAVEQVRYDTQLATLEAKYPAMNPDSSEFDKVVSDEVDTLIAAFESSGMSITKALNKAVQYAIINKQPAKKADDDDDKDDDVDVEKIKADRKRKAQDKALKTVKKTPADLKDVGVNSDKGGRTDGLPDPLKMTQAQFDKLTEAQKAELRDDTMKPH